MDEKFGLRFEIIDSDAVKRIRRERGPTANPFVQYPRMVISGAWLKLPAQQARLDEIRESVHHRRRPQRATPPSQTPHPPNRLSAGTAVFTGRNSKWPLRVDLARTVR